MSKIVAYIRASTDKQDLNHQKLEILEFARKKALSIDEFVEITISSRKTSKQNMDIKQHDMQSKVMITLFSLFAELERDLVSLRTKEALAAKKAQGQILGKPKGTIQRSKFDAHVEKIRELLALGLSVRKTAKLLGYSNHMGLNTYIKKRGIHKNLPAIDARNINFG